jgi:Protein of unknown function (DUF4019)
MTKLPAAAYLFLLAVSSAFAGEKEAAAESAVRGWLSYIDAGEYVTSWTNASALFKKQLTSQAWEDAASSVRRPLGILRSRKVKDAQYATSLPGAPDGEYVVLQFDSSFASKSAAVETVTAVMEDGVWRVVGYFVR